MFFYSVYSFHSFIFFFILFFLVCCLLLFISYVLSYSNYYTDKFFGFECGFDPASDTRSTFKVKFYLVSILFILFDLEIVLLLPWGLTFSSVSVFSYFIVYFFILFIVFGFVYEWRKNCINFDV